MDPQKHVEASGSLELPNRPLRTSGFDEGAFSLVKPRDVRLETFSERAYPGTRVPQNSTEITTSMDWFRGKSYSPFLEIIYYYYI
jgi:hypothetical protein